MSVHAVELVGTVQIGGKDVKATYLKLSDNTVALGNGHNACVPHYSKGFLFVPSTVVIGGTTYSVTAVSDLAFRLCNGITGVEFAEGVTRVGMFAFSGCHSVTEIILPASMQKLGSGAFQSCYDSLEAVTCKGTTPPEWEYNDVFMFHPKGISDPAVGILSAAKKLYVPDESVYKDANYTNPSIGWTTPDGWGSFSYIHVGQSSYHIKSAVDLQILHEIVNVGHMYGQIGRVYLDADVDMSAYTWNCGMGVSEEEAFEGKFFGNGHTISNLTIDTDNYGGFFSHYGGHIFSDVTFKKCTFKCDRADRIRYPNGAFGGVLGECAYVTLTNVCLDSCELSSSFLTNGLLVGRCLTNGGANFYNCVVKDCRFLFTQRSDINTNGVLVGECFGGNAKDCAIFRTEHHTMYGNMPNPFVGKCADSETFNVTRCYNTMQVLGHDTSTNFSYLSSEYEEASNVIYNNVILDKTRNVEYTDASGNTATKQYYESSYEPSKSAYFKTLFMISDLGLENWSYQEGDFPVPSTMEHLLPPPAANRVTYRPASMLDNPRVNGLSPDGYVPSTAWFDMNDATGYRSYKYITSRLWIDDNFSAEKPESSSFSIHNPMLPIGAATIKSTNGITFNRTLDVTPNGTEAYTVPNIKTDSEGNPIVGDNGYYLTEGETTLYEYEVYKATDYTLYLPYELQINGGAELYQPRGVRQDGNHFVVKMDRVEDGIIKPWMPYYIVVNDAPVDLGVDHEIVVVPRSSGIYYKPFEDDKYRMYGNPSKFTPGSDPIVYQLQEDDTWRADNSPIPPFTCYMTAEDGTTSNFFSAVIEVPFQDNGENEDMINTYDGKMVDAELEGRTFYKDNTWYTICLPFDLEDIIGTPLQDASVRRLYNSTYDENEETLKIGFIGVHSLEAGKPYLVKWPRGTRVIDPVFENVTIRDVGLTPAKAGAVEFFGTYSPAFLPGGNQSVLYLGDDNQLFFPEENVMVNAFRGFFIVNNHEVQSGAPIRHVVLSLEDNVVTAIDDVTTVKVVDDNWYTIDGRVLRDKPTTPGIYIHSGKKILIK